MLQVLQNRVHTASAASAIYNLPCRKLHHNGRQLIYSAGRNVWYMVTFRSGRFGSGGGIWPSRVGFLSQPHRHESGELTNSIKLQSECVFGQNLGVWEVNSAYTVACRTQTGHLNAKPQQDWNPTSRSTVVLATVYITQVFPWNSVLSMGCPFRLSRLLSIWIK